MAFAPPSVVQTPVVALRTRDVRPTGAEAPTLFDLACPQHRSCMRKFPTQEAVETFIGGVSVIRRLDATYIIRFTALENRSLLADCTLSLCRSLVHYAL